MLETVTCILPFGEVGAALMPHSLLLTSHEGDCSHHHRPYVPGGSPRLLMEIGEGGTDGLIDLEPATRRKEQ